ncbi:hypothetical protein OG756_36350 [Streptomyces sp. NBC_01310]|uniref:hypothetical protein n=1 Tax=Streptomyces sp. NBC_01310 TaxID=2903820 RepID=UPI0035B636AA|nr:hypothetical protein OG756_36350 [Streptomyces sp. NBC_01310]
MAGPSAARANPDDSFAHTDGTLLAVALAAVPLVYRSVLMPLLVAPTSWCRERDGGLARTQALTT